MCPGLPQGCRASQAQEGGGSWKAEEMKGIKCQKARTAPPVFQKRGKPGEKRLQPTERRLHAASLLSNSSGSCGPQQSRRQQQNPTLLAKQRSPTDKLHPQSDLQVTLKINKVGPTSLSLLPWHQLEFPTASHFPAVLLYSLSGAIS